MSNDFIDAVPCYFFLYAIYFIQTKASACSAIYQFTSFIRVSIWYLYVVYVSGWHLRFLYLRLIFILLFNYVYGLCLRLVSMCSHCSTGTRLVWTWSLSVSLKCLPSHSYTVKFRSQAYYQVLIINAKYIAVYCRPYFYACIVMIITVISTVVNT